MHDDRRATPDPPESPPWHGDPCLPMVALPALAPVWALVAR